MADLGRQLADLLYGESQQPKETTGQKIARRLTGAGETAATIGTGLLGSVPAGLAGLTQLIPTRGRAPDVNRAAQKVEDVQSALTYLPRTETGQRYLENTAGALETLGAPAEYLGEKALQYTGSPGVATAANVLLDPVNFIGLPGSGKATVAATKAAGRAAMAAPRVAGDILSEALTPASRFESQRGAIKMKGGNWLAGEVETAVDPLKTRTGGGMDQADALQEMRRVYPPETTNPDILRRQEPIMRSLEQGAAINKWIDKKLGGYIRNEMGTPEDPIRKLADEGITHFQGLRELLRPASYGEDKRLAEGFPAKGFATTELGKNWEALTDSMVMPSRAGDYEGSSFVERNPWLSKVPKDTPVYEAGSTFETRDLGFDHLIDVLKEDLATGRIRPEQLEKMSMEQAVRRAHQYDQEMAEKAANAATAAREGLPVYKEYPQGYRWIELNKPGAFSAESDSMGHSVRGYEPPPGHPDWTEGSGDAGSLYYGHGGWEGIKSGQAKVYSLVDSKGAPHVTVEIKRGKPWNERSGIFYDYPELENSWAAYSTQVNQAAREKGVERPRDYILGYPEWLKNNAPEVFEKYAQVFAPAPPEITQIKGKSNRAPKEDYLPFVQDFVKSGQWSDVRDFQNTGLVEIGRSALPWPEGTTAEQINNLVGGMVGSTKPPKYTFDQFIQQAKKDLGGKYVNESQMQDWLAKQIQSSSEGKAKGGSVRISDNPDTMRLELATGGAVKMVAGGLTAAKGAAKTAAKGAAKAAKEEKLSVPYDIPRAPAKTKEEIRPIAQRMAEQMTGEFVRPDPKVSKNPAGKTYQQFLMEKELEGRHQYRKTKDVPEPEVTDIEKQKGMVKFGISGDATMADTELLRAGPYQMEDAVPLHGGPRFPLGGEGAWASNNPIAANVQRRIGEMSQFFDAPVLGQYMAMGPAGSMFAQHLADANLQAIDLSKMTKSQIEQFNKLIREGNKKSGPRPTFPGIQDKNEAYLWMAFDPKLRIHFNELMQKPTVTGALNLPDGRIILDAVTEPELRNKEIMTSGLSQFQFDPNVRPEDLSLSMHPTYTHLIPMKQGAPVTRTRYPTPAELEFPDVTNFIRQNYRPQDFVPTFQKSSPRQKIDQQAIDEIKMFEEFMKQYTGKKKGGAVKKQAGGAIKAAAKAVKPSAEQAAKMASQQAEMALKNRAMQELKAQFEDLPLGQQPQGWMSPERLQQKIEEIRRREATPVGGQIPLMQAGGAVKAAARAAKAAAKDASSVLPAAQRDANLAKMLKPSVEKGRLYHGTKLHDEYADAEGQAFEQFASRPTWLAKEPYTAAGYSGAEGSTYPVRAQIKNPLRLEFDANDDAKAAFSVARRLGVDTDHIKSMSRPKFAWQVINHPSFIDAVEKAGYDALMIKEGGYDTYGVFDPRRIKSDIGNRGTFDVTKPEMTKKKGGRVKFTDNLDAMRLAVQKRK